MTQRDARAAAQRQLHRSATGLDRSVKACVATITLALLSSGCSAAMQRALDVETGRRAPAIAAQPPAPCRDGAPALDLLHSWHDSVGPGETRCVTVAARPGELVRVGVDLGARAPLSGAIVELLPPNDTVSILRLLLGNDNRQQLSWTASDSGVHYILLHGIWTIDRTVSRMPARLWVSSVTDAATAQRQSLSLGSSPRTRWLAAHAAPIRTLDPADPDFTDLSFLRTMLSDARLVLLGEADHTSASDFLARTRLVKFLHQELDFDVIAFEAPMFDMELGWRRLRAGAPPQEAFALGAIGQWAQSAQMQPLIRYIAEHAGSDRPLRWTGFDNQPQIGSVQFFAPQLVALLRQRRVPTPLSDTTSREYAILRALAEVRYRRGMEAIPDSAARAGFLATLNDTWQALAAHGDEADAFWIQIIRGMSRHAERVFSSAEGVSLWEASRWRNEQMAENIAWLADEQFAGLRVIIWAANAHVMRLDELPPAAGAGPSMGRMISRRFGNQAFVIATTSYEHAGGRFAADQHPLPEFEQKMQAAGFDYAMVNLREAAHSGGWLAGSFPARPLGHVTADEIWSESADALLFIREQEMWQRHTAP